MYFAINYYGILFYLQSNKKTILILQLEQTIDVLTPLGYGKAIAWIDYGTDTNTIWKVVCYDTGRVRNFYDDDILVYPNEMDGGKVDEDYFSKRDFHATNQSFIKGLKNHFKPKQDAERD